MQSLRKARPFAPADAGGPSSRVSRTDTNRRPPRSRISGWLARAAAIALCAGLTAFIFKFGLPVRQFAQSADALAVKAGLGVNQIAVVGARNSLSDDIFAALALDPKVSLLSYDTTAARKRLEALPWVASARVSRSLPDGLEVAVSERQPFAVWQHKQLMFLIDSDGRTLEPTARTDHADLPLVVGDDADAAAADLMAMLKPFPGILGRLEAAIRVGGRRWDLQLKGAPKLMLPEDRAAEALAWVEKMDREERVFDRRLAAIDLRVAGRVAFVLAPEAPAKAAAHPGARAALAVNRGA